MVWGHVFQARGMEQAKALGWVTLGKHTEGPGGKTAGAEGQGHERGVVQSREGLGLDRRIT